jgi:hypothetical protein
MEPDAFTGYDNPTNNRVNHWGPDAAGMSFNIDGVVGAGAGGSFSSLQTENGYENFVTLRQNGGYIKGLSIGGTIDMFFKSNYGKKINTSALIKGKSGFVTVGLGLMITKSWVYDETGNYKLMDGWSIGGGFGLSWGSQITW